jgi:hypothetical protein
MRTTIVVSVLFLLLAPNALAADKDAKERAATRACLNGDSSKGVAILTLADTDVERGGWTSRTPGSFMHGSGARIAYGNGVFVVTGNWVCLVGANHHPCGVVSSDGITWSNRTMGLPVSSSAAAVALAFGNGTFHLIRSTSADQGMEFCSPDGNAWDACARSSTSGEFYSFGEGVNNVLTYGNGMFVTTATTGAAATSFDRLPDSESAWGHFKLYIDGVGGPIAAGNGGFFMIYPGNTNKGVLITGDTGWTDVTLPLTATWTSIVYGANKFVAFSSVADFAYSGVQ